MAATELGITHPVVVCPASARPVWRRTWSEWGVLSTAMNLRVFSYNEFETALLQDQPQLFIMDEAHYAKNMEADRTRRSLAMAHTSYRVWLLSGTPEPNNPSELYPVLRAVWPDYLRELGVDTYGKFIERFCKVRDGRWGPKVVGSKNEDELRALLERMMLVRDWAEVGSQLPPLRYDHVPLAVSAEDFARIKAEEAELEWDAKLEQVIGSDEVKAKLWSSLGLVKAPLVARVIAEELRDHAYEKIVIFAYHLDVLTYLEEYLRDYGVMRYDGSLNETQRTIAENEFQENEHYRVFLGQLQAAGHAITLTAAHEVALVEQMWAPMENHQAVKRIHRIGQGKPCRARVFSLPGTMDEQQQRSLVNKLNMIDATLPKKEEVQ